MAGVEIRYDRVYGLPSTYRYMILEYSDSLTAARLLIGWLGTVNGRSTYVNYIQRSYKGYKPCRIKRRPTSRVNQGLTGFT